MSETAPKEAGRRAIRRIATEEALTVPEVAEAAGATGAGSTGAWAAGAWAWAGAWAAGASAVGTDAAGASAGAAALLAVPLAAGALLAAAFAAAGGSSGAEGRRSPAASALRRTRSAWASSMDEEWLLTPIPSDRQRSSASLLVSPSSRPSS